MRRGLTATLATLAALSVVLLTVAGCGGSSEPATLDGTSWRLIGWSLSSLDPNDFTITARVRGRADRAASPRSTSYGGPYTAGSTAARSRSASSPAP